jgi:hypothetical protein
MGRILTLLLGLAVVAGAAYFFLTGGAARPGDKPAAVHRLEKVRETTKQIEAEAQQRVDSLAGSVEGK